MSIEKPEFESGTVQIVGKTLIVPNAIHQIANISTVQLGDFSTTKETPKWFYWGVGIGALLLFVGPGWGGRLLGIAALIGVGIAWANFEQTKTTKRNTLTLFMNAGPSPVFISSDYDFVSKMALGILGAMNHESRQVLNFDLRDQRISVGDVADSTVVIGSQTGSISNITG